MSLLMSEGHSQARVYPLPMLWTEVKIVRQRQNRKAASDAVLAQMAYASTQSKKMAGLFKKQIKKLTEQD